MNILFFTGCGSYDEGGERSERIGTISRAIISVSDANDLINDGRAQIGNNGGECKDWARSNTQTSYGPTLPILKTMKNHSQKITLVVTGALLSVLAFFAGTYYSKQSQPINLTDTSANQTQGIKTYTNSRLHYSLSYPAQLFPVVEEQGDSASFKGTPDEPWAIGVSAEKTSYSSTKIWLDAQPKGSSASAGYQPILWVDGSDNGKAIITEYVVVDSDGKKPIYGKVLSAVIVHNGILYKIGFKNQFSINETPSIGSDVMGVVNSFQVGQ